MNIMLSLFHNLQQKKTAIYEQRKTLLIWILNTLQKLCSVFFSLLFVNFRSRGWNCISALEIWQTLPWPGKILMRANFFLSVFTVCNRVWWLYRKMCNRFGVHERFLANKIESTETADNLITIESIFFITVRKCYVNVRAGVSFIVVRDPFPRIFLLHWNCFRFVFLFHDWVSINGVSLEIRLDSDRIELREIENFSTQKKKWNQLKWMIPNEDILALRSFVPIFCFRVNWTLRLLLYYLFSFRRN